MHELSLAINIVDIATREMEKANAEKVTDLEIEAGTLSGVVIEALDFAMQQAVRNSKLEQARITIHEIKATARCHECHKTFGLTDLFCVCPHCESVNVELIQGQELRVKSLKVL